MPEADGRATERPEGGRVGLPSRARNEVGDLWWWFLLRGALALTFGIAVLVRPSDTLTTVVRLVGFYCLLDGSANLVAVLLRAHSRTAWLGALAGVSAGGALLFWPGVPLRGLFLAFGGWAMLTGGSHAFLARSRGESTSTRTLGWALAGLGLAFVLWRGTDVVVIAWVIAVALLVIGATLLYIASRLRFLQGEVARHA